jgi:hypothetical protein
MCSPLCSPGRRGRWRSLIATRCTPHEYQRPGFWSHNWLEAVECFSLLQENSAAVAFGSPLPAPPTFSRCNQRPRDADPISDSPCVYLFHWSGDTHDVVHEGPNRYLSGYRFKFPDNWRSLTHAGKHLCHR